MTIHNETILYIDMFEEGAVNESGRTIFWHRCDDVSAVVTCIYTRF